MKFAERVGATTDQFLEPVKVDLKTPQLINLKQDQHSYNSVSFILKNG